MQIWKIIVVIYNNVQKNQGKMAAAEQEYVWMRSLSDTAGGTLSGKRKIELETYVQMLILTGSCAGLICGL